MKIEQNFLSSGKVFLTFLHLWKIIIILYWIKYIFVAAKWIKPTHHIDIVSIYDTTTANAILRLQFFYEIHFNFSFYINEECAVAFLSRVWIESFMFFK